MTVTLNDIVADVAGRSGRYVKGVASGSSTTVLADATRLFQPDGSWVNSYVRMLTGNNVGQERLISAYVMGQCTLIPELPSAIASGDEYEITPMVHADLLSVVQGAITAADLAWLRIVVDETLTGAEEVALPAACWGVLGVYVDGSLVADYRVSGHAGARSLVFEEAPSGTLRVEYVSAPNLMAGGTDVTGLGEGERQAVDFIVEYALHLLHERSLARNVTGEQARVHLSLSQSHYEKAMRIKLQRRPSGAVRRMIGQMRVGEQE